MLAEAPGESRGLIISAHQVKGLENLIDRMIIINKGKILFNEEPGRK